MKQTLKTTLKGALLAGLAAAAVNSAQAQYAPLGGPYTTGDALAGFTTGSGNELIVNLGSIGSLYSGEEWNLDTLLTGGGFANLNNLNWAVLGSTGLSGSYYSTFQLQTFGNPNSGQDIGELTTLFGSGGASIGSSGYAVQSTALAYSWANQVSGSGPGSPYATAPLSILGGSPDTTTPGSGSFTFAQDSATWFTEGPSGSQQTYGFSLDNSGELLYGVAPVPEPATLSILSGAGLLLLAFRRRLARV